MAQLRPVPYVAPGSLGVNKEEAAALIDPRYATVADNVVLDRAGRIQKRLGWADQTTNAIAGTPDIDTLFEYIQEDGTKVVLSTANNKIYKDIDDYTDANNDITSSTAPTGDDWQFVNFNDSVLGFQQSHAPIEWDGGAGDFTDITYSGTGPDGNAAVAAFGRVWASDADRQTLRYSALLDHTDYQVASGGGTIDMSSVWTMGMDDIVAVAALGANLIVFGRRHIVLWADGSGSSIGLDPTNIYVVDTIEGTGCIARDTVQAIGEGDLWFMSRHGVQSLARVITQKNNPLDNLTKKIRTDLTTNIQTLSGAGTLNTVRSTYSPEEGMYILNMPTLDALYVLDTRRLYQDEDGSILARCMDWNFAASVEPRGLLTRANGDLLLGFNGVVGKYQGKSDDGTAIDCQFLSGWYAGGQDVEALWKTLKELVTRMTVTNDADVTWMWEFDFSGIIDSCTVNYSNVGTDAQYNLAKYGIDEASGGSQGILQRVPGSMEGQYFRFGFTHVSSDATVTMQSVTANMKMMRMA
jgi:hypothetical protein